ncbi:hypothetical protein M5689_005009 [Euphorbia peplus]|nr:hypothetical protein M5689_005009 [Euphorbia peplus]
MDSYNHGCIILHLYMESRMMGSSFAGEEDGDVAVLGSLSPPPPSRAAEFWSPGLMHPPALYQHSPPLCKSMSPQFPQPATPIQPTDSTQAKNITVIMVLVGAFISIVFFFIRALCKRELPDGIQGNPVELNLIRL